MNETDVLQVLRDAIWSGGMAVAPVLAVATIVGLGISLIQALTQVQEMTLTFVPKIVAIVVTVMVALPFMYGQLAALMERVVQVASSTG